MTEYITKEQAEALAAEVNLKWTSYDEFVEDLRRAINLAFKQRLEVVGYTSKHETDAVRDGADHAYMWPDESPRGAPAIPLYALKGASK
jgi:hypothetical protein